MACWRRSIRRSRSFFLKRQRPHFKASNFFEVIFDSISLPTEGSKVTWLCYKVTLCAKKIHCPLKKKRKQLVFTSVPAEANGLPKETPHQMSSVTLWIQVFADQWLMLACCVKCVELQPFWCYWYNRSWGSGPPRSICSWSRLVKTRTFCPQLKHPGYKLKIIAAAAVDFFLLGGFSGKLAKFFFTPLDCDLVCKET